MNQGRIWCVVNPSVGLPLFLGSVALMSFAVHYAILSHSNWYTDFFNGTLTKTSSVDTVAEPTVAVASTGTPSVVFDVVETATPVDFKLQPKLGVLELAPDAPVPG
jgi:light-harvesting protein B-800-850 alpha chain